MKKEKKKLSERIVDRIEEDYSEDLQESEEDFGFKNDETELLSALKNRKRLED